MRHDLGELNPYHIRVDKAAVVGDHHVPRPNYLQLWIKTSVTGSGGHT